MGQNRRKKASKNKQKKKEQEENKPFVSICTPTFNRRPFFEATIQCYLHQDYPRELIEWIIIDDGTDKIEDLVKDIQGVKYFKYDKKMSLGKKRNLMHEKSKGEIIVYMDDDDYYPPTRVSHAVQNLQSNKNALCSGSSRIHIYFKHLKKVYEFGPYGPNHATAGTFAFKRELLNQTSYEEHAALAEEKHFLKNYTIPFVQLDPRHTILVFSHEQNTFDKRKLLENPNPKFVKQSSYTVDYFIKESFLKNFYLNKINNLLETYEPGLPKYKPDVLQQTKEIEERRAKQRNDMIKNGGGDSNIVVQNPDGTSEVLNNKQIVNVMQKQLNDIKQLNSMVQQMKQELVNKDLLIQQLKNELDEFKNSDIIQNEGGISIEIIED